MRNKFNLWKLRGLSIHGKVNIIKSPFLPKMIDPSSVLNTPPEVKKKFNSLVFHFFMEWERQSDQSFYLRSLQFGWS